MAEPFELLRACCVPAGTPAAAAAVRAAAAEVHVWPRVLGAADDHGLVPLLCRRVLDAAADVVGQEARDRLAAATLASAARALAATQQLAVVMTALEHAGVAALPYKGPTLALDAYGDATMRACDDLDIVVAPEDLASARDAIVATGFRPADGLPWRESLRSNGWQGHVALTGRSELLPVELHWRFCDRKLPWNPPVADVLRRATRRSVAGVSLPCPDRNDQLLLVLLHAARHGWDRLEGIACVGALLAGAAGTMNAVDPDTFVARARSVGGARASLVGLEVTRRLLGVALPNGLVAAAHADSQVRALADVAVERIRAGEVGDVRDARLHLAALDGAADRLRYVALAALLPTPRDRQILHLPWPLVPLYVPLRLARLTRLAGRAFGR